MAHLYDLEGPTAKERDVIGLREEPCPVRVSLSSSSSASQRSSMGASVQRRQDRQTAQSRPRAASERHPLSPRKVLENLVLGEGALANETAGEQRGRSLPTWPATLPGAVRGDPQGAGRHSLAQWHRHALDWAMLLVIDNYDSFTFNLVQSWGTWAPGPGSSGTTSLRGRPHQEWTGAGRGSRRVPALQPKPGSA